MTKKESVLSDAEKDSFELEKFIFHIIIEKDPHPIFLDEIILDSEQIDFFKKRFRDISEGTQHIFIDKSNSTFFSECTKLMEDTELNFLNISKRLTSSFKSFHKKSANNGVFITALVKVLNSRQLIFLLKLDHKKVYEYKVKNSKALLTEITQTFVEDRKAIQKAALIDVSDFYAWDVLASDRNNTGKKALTDYFANFLTVQEKETPSTLTEKVVSAVRRWAIANKENLGLDDVSTYKSRSISYLEGAAKYKTRDCLSAVIAGFENEAERNKQLNSIKSFFDEEGLSGQSFIPNKNRLDRATKKNTRQTAEGVKIIWEGDAKDLNINIPNEKDANDGLYHIVIKTNKIETIA